MSDVIEVRDGGVALGGRPVLRHLDLSVPRGQWLALMGANGSGKSTLVRAILGLHELSTGEIRLFGTPVSQFRDRQRVGFVPQRAGAGGGVPASVREVVSAGRLARRRLFRPLTSGDRAAVDRALETVGLADRAGDPVDHLSGGQQQRVLIARALAGEPELLVLDEPTAGVDLPHQEALAAALHRLQDVGATVVLVAHELGPMRPFVDRVVVMRDGRISYDGAPLSEADVHRVDADGHHHSRPDRHEHAPHLASPTEPGILRKETW